jgi:hypothetical protein
MIAAKMDLLMKKLEASTNMKTQDYGRARDVRDLW